MSQDNTIAKRQKRFRERREAEGKVLVSKWVPNAAKRAACEALDRIAADFEDKVGDA